MRVQSAGTVVDWGRRATPLVTQAFYINLDKSIKRKKRMEKQLKRLQQASGDGLFRFERIRAADPTNPWVVSKINSWEDQPQEMQDLQPEEINGTIACYYSHLLAWKHALEHVKKQTNDASFVLIMEDDAALHFKSLDDLATKLEGVPDDADVVALGTFGSVRPSDIESIGPDGSYVFRASAPFGRRRQNYEDDEAVWLSNHSEDLGARLHPATFYGGMHAYLLRISRLPGLIEYFEHEQHSYLPDAGTIWNSTHMRKYVLYPPLATQVLDLGATRNASKFVKSFLSTSVYS